MQGLIAALALAGALTLAAAPAGAQIYETSPWHGRIGFGAAEPIGDAAEIVDTGWDFTGGFGYEPLDSRFGVRVDFLWSWMDLDRRVIDLFQGTGGGAGINYMTVSGILSTNRQRSVSFYGFAGGGLYKKWLDVYEPGVGCYWDPWYGYICVPTNVSTFYRSDTDWGAGIGAGMNLALGSGTGGFYVEAAYHNIYGDNGNAEFVPIILGYRW